MNAPPTSSTLDGSAEFQPRAEGFAFRAESHDAHARTGVLTTPHASIETPIFMPVGTQGSVKTLTPDEVAGTGAKLILGNTYHLWLRPGEALIDSFGGLHQFARWPHAMLTDSGGYQAFSLGSKGAGRGDARVAMREEGVEFRSHLDGSKRCLSPEEAVRVQKLIGADIQMQLDVCPEGNSSREVVVAAIDRTTRWAKRALVTPRKPGQALFGIVQGACFADLRRMHAEQLAELPFDGLALGGFSVGEPIENMHATLAEMAHEVAPERPRYLMGVGTPKDLLAGIAAGIDMFDCVLPTRNARNGQVLTRFGKLSIKQARFRDDKRPLDASCPCAACQGGYSRAYLRHLFVAGEILPLRLFSLHNLTFYAELMAGARRAIRAGTFAQYRAELLTSMSGDGNDARA